ncbi:MAG: hypothetical protein ABI594_20730 [Ginsengibacter sp.]
MKKIISTALTLCICFYINGTVYSQSNITRVQTAGAPTSQNVLQWAKEAKPNFDKISAKLEKIKPVKQKDIETKRIIVQAETIINEIIAKGSKLSTGEARKHNAWFLKAIVTLQNNCPNGPDGSECCFSCNSGHHPGGGSGWNASWCFAHCFVANFPGLN